MRESCFGFVWQDNRYYSWKQIRLRRDKVSWSRVIWFTQPVQRYSFFFFEMLNLFINKEKKVFTIRKSFERFGKVKTLS